MATEFSREFFADNRIVKASLRCAHKLREKDLDRIKSEIKKLYDATEVILNITVDESLLSGYVLQVGDRVFDNSGRHQLDKMMEGKPSLATLKTRIEDYKPAETSAEGGVVIKQRQNLPKHLGNLSGFIKTFNRYNIIECTLREHSIIMNKRKLWGCPKTSLLILNEYLTEQTCKQSIESSRP